MVPQLSQSKTSSSIRRCRTFLLVGVMVWLPKFVDAALILDFDRGMIATPRLAKVEVDLDTPSPELGVKSLLTRGVRVSTPDNVILGAGGNMTLTLVPKKLYNTRDIYTWTFESTTQKLSVRRGGIGVISAGDTHGDLQLSSNEAMLLLFTTGDLVLEDGMKLVFSVKLNPNESAMILRRTARKQGYVDVMIPRENSNEFSIDLDVRGGFQRSPGVYSFAIAYSGWSGGGAHRISSIAINVVPIVTGAPTPAPSSSPTTTLTEMPIEPYNGNLADVSTPSPTSPTCPPNEYLVEGAEESVCKSCGDMASRELTSPSNECTCESDVLTFDPETGNCTCDNGGRFVQGSEIPVVDASQTVITSQSPVPAFSERWNEQSFTPSFSGKLTSINFRLDCGLESGAGRWRIYLVEGGRGLVAHRFAKILNWFQFEIDCTDPNEWKMLTFPNPEVVLKGVTYTISIQPRFQPTRPYAYFAGGDLYADGKFLKEGNYEDADYAFETYIAPSDKCAM